MAPRVAIIYYSVYGHIAALAHAEKRGVELAGGIADLIPEILPSDVLKKFSAPIQDPNVPFIQPEGSANSSSQWAAFWERTTSQRKANAYWGKVAGVFTCTTSLSSGMEMTAANWIPLFAEYGIIFMPLGTKIQYALGDIEISKGGSPWGAGTYCATDHTRFPTAIEIYMAETQGVEMAAMLLGGEGQDIK